MVKIDLLNKANNIPIIRITFHRRNFLTLLQNLNLKTLYYGIVWFGEWVKT